MPGAELPMVRGCLAEARGNVTGALAGYDEAGTEEARLRADSLRYLEGLTDSLVASVATLAEGAEPSEAMLLAALDQRSPDPRVVARARTSTTPLARYLTRWADSGCTNHEPSEVLARMYGEVARLEARCADERGDSAVVLQNEQLGWRARTALAAAGTTRGERAMQMGNGGLAWMCFRRVLRIYPTTTRAAIGLARLHERDGRHEEAQQVLEDAMAATEHLTEARGRIVSAAVALHVDLTVPDDVAGPGQSSASTVPAESMTE